MIANNNIVAGLSFSGVNLSVALYDVDTVSKVGKMSMLTGLTFATVREVYASQWIVNDYQTVEILKQNGKENLIVVDVKLTTAKFPSLVEKLQTEKIICTDEKSNKIASKAILEFTEREVKTGEFLALLNGFYKAYNFSSWGWNRNSMPSVC